MDIESIFKKLKLDDTKKLLIVNAPESYKALLTGITHDQNYTHKDSGTYDFVQVFAIAQNELERLTESVADAGKYDCLFWLCYPKGGGSIKSDIKRDTVWSAFSLAGLRPVAQISIDNTWSALRGRPGELVGKK